MKKIFTLIALSGLALTSISQSTARLPLIEGLTSNTCGPCAGFNSSYNPIVANNNPNDANNPGVAIVKYQMDWPSPGTDRSYNGDAEIRRSFYGTTGIPDWYIDGQPNGGSQSEINSSQTSGAPCIVKAAYTLTGTTIDVTVQIIPLVDLGNGNRCYIALANKQYNHSGGTNGENTFYHVMRKMLPTAGGTFLPNLLANDTIYVNQSYTYNVSSLPVQGSYDFWNANFEVVCWVQKTNGTKPVQNATIAPEGVLGVDEGDNDDFGMLMFPNPTTESAQVVFDGNADEESSITVFNQLGEVVFQNNYGKLSGRQQIEINTSNLANGLYFVRINIGNQVATQSLIKE